MSTDVIRSVLKKGDYTLANVTVAGDERLATFVATNLTARVSYGDERIELVVSDAGYVRSMRISDGETEQEPAYPYEYRVTTLDVEEVTKPGWLENAPDPREVDVLLGIENCTLLTVEHDGGDPVPAGTVVRATVDGETYRATIETTLRADEARYLVRNDDDLQVVSEEPATDTFDSPPDDIDFAITTENGLQLISGSMGVNC
jgi:hypothetical protein